MFKDTILRRIVVIILLSVLLSAVLTTAAFYYSGGRVFSGIKAKELRPRAEYLANITAEYLQGLITKETYERSIGRGFKVWDASMYAYDACGDLFAYPANEDSTVNKDAISGLLQNVLKGETVYSPNTKNHAGVLIGEPVVSRFGNVIGALFLVKPLNELNAAMGSLIYALIISMIASSLIMILPAYLGSRSIVRPIRQMNVTANAMAGGNFTAKAEEEGTDELVQLGRSLNHLSAALSATISDLTLEKNRLHAVINGIGEGIIAIDAEGKIIKTNSAALRLLGGSYADDITALPAYRQAAEDIGCVLGGETVSKELKVRDRILRVAITPLTDGGRGEGAVMLIRDITEASRLEQTRTEYVANVSHELRTPIASIRGLADALNDGLVKKDEDKARYYGYILRESMRLSRLIDDLLELSRLQSGTIAFKKQFISINELIEDVADRYVSAAREKGLNVEIDIGEPYKVYTNPDRAEQVLVALTDNAIKYGDSGTLRFSAEKKGDSLYISVSNPGSIADEDIDHVFERFYKADKSHAGQGTGLGLSIVNEVLELLGERIWVKSENGTVTFTFTLSTVKPDNSQ
ncbi:MAG: histidine kinase dimerization/phospho-acceptor domain-containing protein [Christensenellales bacterium]